MIDRLRLELFVYLINSPTSKKICVSQRSSLVRSEFGFTLIEIMIVLGIIASLLVFAVPKLTDPKSPMRNMVRQMSVVAKEAHNAARIYNSTFRISLDMRDPKAHKITVESSTKTVTLMTEDQIEEQQKLTSKQREDLKIDNGFSADVRVLKKPLELPKGFVIESVEYANRKDPIRGGMAYVHFFPQGMAEDAVIHFSNRENLHWTLAIHPLTGKATVYDREVLRKDLQVK